MAGERCSPPKSLVGHTVPLGRARGLEGEGPVEQTSSVGPDLDLAMRWLLALLLAVPLSLAGCLGDDGDDPPEEEDPPDRERPRSPSGGSGSTSPPRPPRTPPPPPPTELDVAATGCERLGLLVPAEAAALRVWVPEEYVIVGEDTTKALLVVTFLTCEGLAPGTNAPTPGSFSDVGVVIEAPDGSEGDHLYRIWQATDHFTTAAALQRFGLIEGFVPGTGVTVEAPVPLAASTASGLVPWAAAAYSGNATIAGPAAPDVPRTETWWFEGFRGLVTVTYEYTPASSASVAGDVSARVGSPMATFLGAPTVPATGTLDAVDISIHAQVHPKA